MNYQKVKMKNYNIYFIKTQKFKTFNISLHFSKKLTKEDEVYCGILRRILSYATAKYPNLNELGRASKSLYSPSFQISFYRTGLDLFFCLETTFINDKYTEPGMNEKSIEYVFSHIWDPYIKNGTFDEEIFELSRHEYVERMRDFKDNPDAYAEERIWEELDIYPFGEFNPKECLKYALTLTSKDLYNYYLSLFENFSLDIFVTGDIDQDKFKNILDKLVIGNFKPRDRYFQIDGVKRKEKRITEKSDTKQSILIFGLRYIGLTEFERKYVSLVYNNILGSGWNSKLNKVIRGDNSLCYYIYSSRKITESSAFIYSGIDAKNADKTIKLIKEQMAKMYDDITDEELNRVKDIYYNALTEIEDSEETITNNVISMVLADTDSIEKRRANMAKVTIDDVKNMASKVNIDTIYLLEGENDEEENI